jgi:hypothetical protein
MRSGKMLSLLIACSFALLLFQGCKKSEKAGSTGGGMEEQAKQVIPRDVNAGGANLTQQKDAAVKDADQSFSAVKKDTQQLLIDLKKETSERWQAVSADLKDKLDYTGQQLDKLKNTTAEKAKDAEQAFDAAMQKLKEAYDDAKKQFTQTSNSQTQ